MTKHLSKIGRILQFLKAILGANHGQNLLDILSERLVDFDLLLELLNNNLVLLLQLLMFLSLVLKLFLSNRLDSVEICFVCCQLDVHAIELFDFLLLVDALLAQLDPRLLSHAHVVKNILTVSSLLRQLAFILLNHCFLRVHLFLLLLHCL